MSKERDLLKLVVQTWESPVDDIAMNQVVQAIKVYLAADSVTLPFVSADFKASWESWEAYRRELKKKLTPSTRKMQLAKCQKWGEKKSIDAITRSIENGWQGLFEPNVKPNQPEKKNYGW